jgi:hypothetical protein
MSDNDDIWYKLWCSYENYCNDAGVKKLITEATSKLRGLFYIDNKYKTDGKGKRGLYLGPITGKPPYDYTNSYKVFSQKKNKNDKYDDRSYYLYKVGILVDEEKGIFNDSGEIIETDGGIFFTLGEGHAEGLLIKKKEIEVKGDQRRLLTPRISPEKKREEQERLEQERLEQQRQEQERLEQERLEQEEKLQENETCRGRFCNNLTNKVRKWFGINPKFKSKKSKTKSKKSKTKKSKTKKSKTKSKKSKPKTKKSKSMKSKIKSKKSKSK